MRRLWLLKRNCAESSETLQSDAMCCKEQGIWSRCPSILQFSIIEVFSSYSLFSALQKGRSRAQSSTYACYEISNS